MYIIPEDRGEGNHKIPLDKYEQMCYNIENEPHRHLPPSQREGDHEVVEGVAEAEGHSPSQLSLTAPSQRGPRGKVQGAIFMGELNTPIDVISVCSADGEIKPLRFRMEEEDHTLRRIDIDQVISTRKIQYVGIEAHIFLCKALVEGKEWLFELKYTIRTHCWCLFRRIL